MNLKEASGVKLIFWEMNEINFDYVDHYIKKGYLPNWKRLIDQHGLFKTTSEKKYDQIEPWIQWPTVRTGLSFREHRVYRLGDMINSKHKEHWEILKEQGFSVAAVSPMNSKNNAKDSCFWVQDPWVNTEIIGTNYISRFCRMIKQAVNDNSKEHLSFSSLIVIIETILFKTKINNFFTYIKLLVLSLFKKQHWSKAIFFDLLLSDVFCYLWEKHRPDFSVLFMNSGAHIQHHYLYNSTVVNKTPNNPEWYIRKDIDPLLEILQCYDNILKNLLKYPGIRLMVSTGLRQVPYQGSIYYWRLKNHGEFLRNIGIEFSRVQPRMSRDFLIEFHSVNDAIKAENKLRNITSINNEIIFGEIDNRGINIFVTLTYSKLINKENSTIIIGNDKLSNFNDYVIFVALKNGHHDQIGYFIDTNLKPYQLKDEFPVKNIFKMVMNHFGIDYLDK